MRVSAIAVLTLSCLLTWAQAQTDYCPLCPDNDHTMCKYSGYGPTCKLMYITSVTAAEKQSILDLHNQVRNKVALGQETRGAPGPQPSAANMQKMVWDDELATIAQRWTNQCTFGHDTCRLVPRFEVGQCVAWGASTSNNTVPNWLWAIQTAWYGEVALYDSAKINPYFYDAGTAHYTQVAWALTNKVGCGYAYYTSTGNSYYNKMYICNYGPQGNWEDQPLYVAGTPCSQCPSGTSCDTTYPGLCAVSDTAATTTTEATATTTDATETTTVETTTTAPTTTTTAPTTLTTNSITTTTSTRRTRFPTTTTITTTTPSTTSSGSTGGTGTTASTASYCAICSDNSMCLYPTDGPGSACQPSLNRNINSAEKQAIIDQHNNLRNKVAKGLEIRGSPGPQPQAANMRKFAWDNEIAAIAQRWADQCTYSHDKCRDVARFKVGQNIAYQGSTQNIVTANWTWPIMQWYDEVLLYSNANVNPFSFAGSTGHYTQIAWADTNLIGCGYAAYKTSPGDIWYNRYYVCNYGKSGNWQGEALYIAGSPCSKCPSGTTCDSTYTGLCK